MKFGHLHTDPYNESSFVRAADTELIDDINNPALLQEERELSITERAGRKGVAGFVRRTMRLIMDGSFMQVYVDDPLDNFLSAGADNLPFIPQTRVKEPDLDTAAQIAGENPGDIRAQQNYREALDNTAIAR